MPCFGRGLPLKEACELHVSIREKRALMFNVFYFSPWTVLVMWESGTWIRLTAGNY